jgi:NADPH:quinone reductase-like Zn-dependent oxidoreductase
MATTRAAIVHRLGELPQVGDVELPERGAGEALVRVLAAPVNPIDLALAAGTFYRGRPEVPFVPGKEAVGEVLEGDALAPGQRVWLEKPGGLGGQGAIAEQVVVAERDAVVLPDVGIEPANAAALGIAGLAAWYPLSRLARLERGERVLVLGATGAVGTIGVQAARILGAGTIVAAARDREALERLRQRGADAIVVLGEGRDDLADAFREAAGGPIDVTLDPIWGDAAVAAAVASGPMSRLLHVGRSASNTAALPSSAIRGKGLSIIGHTHFNMTVEERAQCYRELVEHAASGAITVDVTSAPLDDIAAIWQRQAEYPRGKIVITP